MCVSCVDFSRKVVNLPQQRSRQVVLNNGCEAVTFYLRLQVGADFAHHFVIYVCHVHWYARAQV